MFLLVSSSFVSHLKPKTKNVYKRLIAAVFIFFTGNFCVVGRKIFCVSATCVDKMKSYNGTESSKFVSNHEVSWSRSAPSVATNANGVAPSGEMWREKTEVYTTKTSKNPNKAFYGCFYFKVIKNSIWRIWHFLLLVIYLFYVYFCSRSRHIAPISCGWMNTMITESHWQRVTMAELEEFKLYQLEKDMEVMKTK